MRIGKQRFLAAACISLMSLAGSAPATNLPALVRDTQQTAQSANQFTLVWWIPQEYWQASLNNNPGLSAQQRTDILTALQDYQIVAVIRGKIGIQGLTEVPSKAELLSHTQFEVNHSVIEPLADDKIGVGTQAMLGAIRPLIAGMLGQLGQGMQFLVYPSTKEQQRFPDPLKAGTFQYTLYDQTFLWRLPLGSLLPNKLDPTTHESFPGNYDFNPYTGGKLSVQ